MADDKDNDLENGEDGPSEDGGQDDATAKKGMPKKKMVILGAAGVAVAAIIGIVLFLFTGGDEAEKKTLIELPGPSVYVEMPPFIADLKTGRCRSPVIQLALSVEVADNHQDRLKEVEPQLLDAIRMHLRDQTREHLMGKQGAEQLRADIQLIAGNMMAPAEVRGILFKKFLLQ